ncbi:PLP-dependent transferase [Viridothelium virens]|uniref:PLP-dependent transferase n=1 Tax=Viridothelium virens TaxID=1048519 RepID=A0A6A6HH35_VIRVR|nr:PLP-dependent transferase [Viridothelium virens]
MSNSKIPSRPATSSNEDEPPLARADEVADLLRSIQDLIVPFVKAADADANSKPSGHGTVVSGGAPRTTLVEHHPPQKLQSLMDLELPDEGKGKEGVMAMAKQILQYSVNTWDQGFMDKLYHGNNAIGLISELLLATLNTNVHVYSVSPALTLIEKHTTRHLAQLFGLHRAPSASTTSTTNPPHPHPANPTSNPHAGGISQPGGSASNLLALLTARNTHFPSSKSSGVGTIMQGTGEGGATKRPVVFASAHAHYSTSKAASLLGLGDGAVRAVPVDAGGRMTGAALAKAVQAAREEGELPFFVCATAGTTVMGSFDEVEGIAEVCAREGLWLHVDASWGGGVVFSERLKEEKLKGVERADSVAVNPHKMLGVSLTCSFLLVRDVRVLHKANQVSAGYLFHGDEDGGNVVEQEEAEGEKAGKGLQDGREVWDLAELTPQCGRKGEALKMFLGWLYYGRTGYAAMVERAYDTTAYLAKLVQEHSDMTLISEQPPPCLQVCFYYAKKGTLVEGNEGKKKMSKVTSDICRRLMRGGFMIDYAPGEKGLFLRVVVNSETRRGTVEGLVKAIEEEGEKVWRDVVET